MKRSLWHRTHVLLLALLLGLGASQSYVQRGVMAAEIAAVADGVHHGPGACDGCGGGQHEGMDAGACLTVCASVAQALVPQELLMPPSGHRADFQPARLYLSGQFHNPDHGPPKILTFG